MSFKDKLDKCVAKNNSLLCIGLDSDLSKIPEHLKKEKHPQFSFNKAIIDVTHDLVCAYKPNTAFYESRGKTGIEALKMTCNFLRENYPEVPIILDAKRADIGNTNEGYAKFAFDYLEADAITVHPYLGYESLKPFLDRKEKGIFVLCRTSNPGGGELQDLVLAESAKDTSDGVRMHSSEVEESVKPLYQIIAEHVVSVWNYNGNCGLVVGATYPAELKVVRRIVGDDFPLLIPGIGAQGGDTGKTVKAGADDNSKNAIINSSRGIIFASQEKDFAEKARFEAKKLKEEINRYR